MRVRLFSVPIAAGALLAFGFLALAGPAAQVQTLKFEAQLLWGTNEKTSPDAKHKPVEPDIEKKLKDLPLKWSHYFVVNRKSFEVQQDPANPNKTEHVALSERCAIEVRSLGRETIEISHFGKGEKVWTGKQAFPKGEILVLGGNAPSSNSWFLVLKRLE